MTACVNKKSKRVAAVVTASLVGALSIGAPAVALATGTTNIDMLAASWADGATVTKAKDNKGNAVSNPAKAEFTVASGKYLIPTQVANKFMTTDVTAEGYTLTYAPAVQGDTSKGSDGKFHGLVKNWNYRTADGKVDFTFDGTLSAEAADAYFAGKLETYSKGSGKQGDVVANACAYTVTVSKGTDHVEATFKLTEGAVADGIYAYVGTDTDNKDIVFTGENLLDRNGDSDIKFAKADGTAISVEPKWTTAAGGTVPSDATIPGDYIASFKYDGVDYNLKVTVSPLDLTKLSLSVGDVVAGDTKDIDSDTDFKDALAKNAEVNSNVFAVSAVSGPNGTTAWDKTGEYKVTVAGASGYASKGYVTGSATVTYSRLDSDLFKNGAKVYYGSKAMANPYDVLLLEGESIDVTKVKVVKGDTTYGSDDIEVSFKNSKNEKVDASALSEAGTYTMTVRVKPVQEWATGQWSGGSTEVKINVKGEAVDASKDLAFYFDGDLATGSSVNPKYDGTDQLKKLSVSIKANDKTYEQGKDFTLEVKNEAGKEVTEAVDSDVYTVVVKPVTFEWKTGNAESEYTFTIDLDKADLSVLVADTVTTEDAALENGSLEVASNKFYVAYTGKAVEIPAVKYQVTNEKKTEYKYVELDSKLYNVVSIKDGSKTVKEAVEAGKTYTVEIALTDDAAKNYELGADATFKFDIKEFGHFTDVDSAEWYSVPVEQAWKQYYINGISGTNLFAPNAEITRADAICIIFNMAGGDVTVKDDEFSYSEDKGYVTGFNDVDGKQYFGKALAWAKAAGVANGSNGQFRPYDKITREEFASLLANFAKSKGDYEAVDADEVLGSATDFSAWAKENVAWAKANKVMGNGGFINGTGNITRAEVASMAVNYQPDDLLARPDRTK